MEEVQYWFSRRRPSWFPVRTILATSDLQVTWILPKKFESITQLPFRVILAILDLQVTPILPIKFWVNGLFYSGELFKIDFQDGNCGSLLAFLNRTILAIFDLQVTLMLSTKFWVNWPFGSGEAAQNRFPSSDHGGHLGFQIKFQVSWPFGSGDEAKSRFSRQQPSWQSILNFFFWTVRPVDSKLDRKYRADLQIKKKIKSFCLEIAESHPHISLQVNSRRSSK